MKALLGRKVGMSQMFSESGEQVAVTLISVPTNDVTLKRISDRDGYAAVQLGLRRESQKSRQDGGQAPVKGQKDKGKLTPGEVHKQYVARREFLLEVEEGTTELTVEQFEVGDVVEVVGTSKGKGFQGVVKRHGFKGGPASHGHRHVLRKPGSIGSAFPQHVMKGKRMAGRMGADRVTVKNLQVVWVDPKEAVLGVKGAVPGSRGSILEIRSTND